MNGLKMMIGQFRACLVDQKGVGKKGCKQTN